jgi:hypothetical protein
VATPARAAARASWSSLTIISCLPECRSPFHLCVGGAAGCLVTDARGRVVSAPPAPCNRAPGESAAALRGSPQAAPCVPELRSTMCIACGAVLPGSELPPTPFSTGHPRAGRIPVVNVAVRTLSLRPRGRPVTRTTHAKYSITTTTDPLRHRPPACRMDRHRTSGRQAVVHERKGVPLTGRSLPRNGRSRR